MPLRPTVYSPQLWIIREKVALNWKWGQMLGSWWSLTAFWAMVQRLCTGFQAGHHRGCGADLSGHVSMA